MSPQDNSVNENKSAGLSVNADKTLSLRERLEICWKRSSWYAMGKPLGMKGDDVKKMSEGKRNVPLEAWEIFADVAGVRVDWLVTGKGPMAPIPKIEIPVLKTGESSPVGGSWSCTRDILANSIPGATEGSLVAFRLGEKLRHQRLQCGEWLFIDQNRKGIRESGCYCLEVGGQFIVRDVEFRYDGKVLMFEPSAGDAAPEVHDPEELLKKLRVVGRVVARFQALVSAV